MKVIQAEKHWQRGSIEGDAMAQKLAKEAISMDPNFAAAYALLSRTQFREVRFRTTKTPKKTMALSIENAKKVVSLDPSSADALSLLGFLYTLIKQHDKGIETAERGMALDPNNSRAYTNLGLTLLHGGMCEEAIELLDKAIRISPIPSANILFSACFAYRNCERYEEAIALGKKAVQLEPDSIFAHSCLAGSYALSGRIDDAKAEAAEILRINPKHRLYKGKGIYRDPEDTERIRKGLRMAGIPE